MKTFLITLLTGASMVQPEAHPPIGWVEHGVAAFSNLALDFNKRIARTPLGDQVLVDCSDNATSASVQQK